MTLTEWVALLPTDLRPRFEAMLEPENHLLGVPIVTLFGLAPPDNAAQASEAERRAWAQTVLARQTEVLGVAAPLSLGVGAIFHTPGDHAKIEPNLRKGIAQAHERWTATHDPVYRSLETEGLRQLARWLARQRRGHEAAEAYTALLAIEPQNALEWQSLGAIYKNQLHNDAEARRCFQQALALDPQGSHVARRELSALEDATSADPQPGLWQRLLGRLR